MKYIDFVSGGICKCMSLDVIGMQRRSRAPAATSSTNTLTASSVPFFLPSCRAQGSTQLSNLYLPRLSFSRANIAWMLCVCSCVVLQLADVGANGGATFQRAGEELSGAAQEVHAVLGKKQEQIVV